MADTLRSRLHDADAVLQENATVMRALAHLAGDLTHHTTDAMMIDRLRTLERMAASAQAS